MLERYYRYSDSSSDSEITIYLWILLITFVFCDDARRKTELKGWCQFVNSHNQVTSNQVNVFNATS